MPSHKTIVGSKTYKYSANKMNIKEQEVTIMVCEECRKCQKFITNDCKGAAEFNKEECQKVLMEKSNEVDVSGCC